MHGLTASHDRHSMHGGDGLMPKADAQNGNPTLKRTQQIRADARFIRSAGPGRNHQTGGIPLDGVIDRDAIISNNFDIDARRKSAQALHEIPCE